MTQKVEFRVQDLLSIGMTLVVLGVGLAYGLSVMGDVQTDMGEDYCESRGDDYSAYNSSTQSCSNASAGSDQVSIPDAHYNATGDSITGVAKIPEKLPTIATVIVAAVIIGILVTYLWRG